MLCALVKDDTVVDIKVLSASELAVVATQYQNVFNLANQLEVQIGWVLYGGNLVPAAGWVFSDGAYTPNPSMGIASLKITRLAFRNRFTSAEKAAIYTVAATPQGIGLKIYLDDLSSSTYIDLVRPDTIGGIQQLAALGIIAAERVAVILSTTVRSTELFRDQPSIG